MKLPPYAKNLLTARRGGKPMWLVVVAVGAMMDHDTLRGEAGVYRIGLPFDIDLARTDLSPLMGLDVLLTWFEPSMEVCINWMTAQPNDFDPRSTKLRFCDAMPEAVWKAGPSTLWSLEVGRLVRVVPCGPRQRLLGLPTPLLPNAGLRAQVMAARRRALIAGEGLFSRPEFREARELAALEDQRGAWIRQLGLAVEPEPVGA